MISVPVWLFVILVISLVINVVLTAYLLIGHHFQKRDYYEYLEEEYGKKVEDKKD